MITFTRTSATEVCCLTPVQHAPASTSVVEYRLTINPTGTWSLKGCYGRDLTFATADVQLSDTTDTSVWAYALQVGDAAAPQSSYDYIGLAHGNELATAVTMTVDGVDVFSLPVGSIVTGLAFVIEQAITMLLPKHIDGTPDGATVCGSSTLTHLFTDAGLEVHHSHTIAAGFQALNWYAASQPASIANINRFQIDQLQVQTPANDGTTVLGYGIRAIEYTAWHTTAHNYRLVLRLPSGGPSEPADWSHAGPQYGFFLDDATRKFRVAYIGDSFPGRQPQPANGYGPIAHVAVHTVEWGPPAPLSSPRSTPVGAVATTACSGGAGSTRWL